MGIVDRADSRHPVHWRGKRRCRGGRAGSGRAARPHRYIARRRVWPLFLYTSYDFASAAAAQQIELSDNGRTTTFSLEARDGQEEVRPGGSHYRFHADAETAIAVLTDNGARYTEYEPPCAPIALRSAETEPITGPRSRAVGAPH